MLMQLAQPYTAGELAFVNVQRYLALNRLPVPGILWDDSAQGFILLEDLGDVTLEAALQGASREQTVAWYRQALDILLQLQYPQGTTPRASCVAFCLAFDVEKLMWELDFFSTHMIRQLCAQRLTPAAKATLRGQFWKLTATLAANPASSLIAITTAEISWCIRADCTSSIFKMPASAPASTTSPLSCTIPTSYSPLTCGKSY